jgi:hypothetical protein
MKWAGHVARMGEEINVYKVWVGKPEGKRPLGIPRLRWEDGIRMDLREIGLGLGGLDSTGSVQGPVVGCCECGDVPSGSCATELVNITDFRKLHSSSFIWHKGERSLCNPWIRSHTSSTSGTNRFSVLSNFFLKSLKLKHYTVSES